MCNCSKIAKTLIERTKNVPFYRLDSAKNAFQAVKNAIITAILLAQFDTSKRILWQKEPASTRLVLSCNKITMIEDILLHSSPWNWVNTSRTSLRTIWSFSELWKLWQPGYSLYGQKFVVHTDQYPLKYLKTPKFHTLRQVHWLNRISMLTTK